MHIKTILSIIFAAQLISTGVIKSNAETQTISLKIKTSDFANHISVSFTPLKYNKKFVFSYTIDDAPAAAYGKAFTLINNKWMDDTQFYHYTQKETTGKIPGKTLGFTDGCGNEIRFPLGVAIWPTQGTIYGDFMGNNISEYNPYLTWSDLNPILDFGGTIYFHNMNERLYNPNSVSEIVSGLEKDQEKTIEKTGRGMKILMRPDGNDKYVEAGRQFNDIVMCGVAGWDKTVMYPYQKQELRKMEIKRDLFEDVTPENRILRLENIRHSDNPQWEHIYGHTPKESVLDFLTQINDLFGKEGDDSIWFTTAEELYDYLYIRQNAIISTSYTEQTLQINITWTKQPYEYFPGFSLLISGIPENKNISVESGETVYGLSYSFHTDGLLINVNADSTLLEKAEKYLQTYSETKEEDNKNDALYFIKQLKPELQKSFLDRLNDVSGIKRSMYNDFPFKISGNSIIIENSAYPVYVYRTDGSLIDIFPANQTIQKKLPKGIYIINHKKIIIL